MLINVSYTRYVCIDICSPKYSIDLNGITKVHYKACQLTSYTYRNNKTG